jgi:nucleotide-binding universal stress UspA family protein
MTLSQTFDPFVQPPAPDIRRVLLATDLSPTSGLATDWAFELARRNDAALLVVSVIDPRELAKPVSVTFLVWTGEPGESIVAAAESEDVDVILVGAHTRGRIDRLLMGSVSEHVARHAPCPVLIVREIPGSKGSFAGQS